MKNLFLILIFALSIQNIVGLPTIPESNNALDLKLYVEVTKNNNDNAVYSPYCLQSILALTAVGAKGETASQIKAALKLDIPNEEIKKAFKEVTEKFKNVSYVTIHSASKAYLADGFTIEPDFLKTAKEDFNTGVENIDFNKGKEAAENINSWVEKETQGKIKELMKESQLTVLTKFVLLNTLYFRGVWLRPFDESDTSKRDFHNFKGEKVQVDTMKVAANFEIMKLPELKVTLLKLPLANKKAEFIILLPDELDGLPEAEKNSEQIWSYYNYTRAYVKVYLPKFKVESSIDMIPLLKNMGITNLFSKADLSGITKEDVHVTAVQQKTFIDVNEVGIEAASATSAVGEGRSLHFSKQTSEIFQVDHPFIYCILYDNVGIISGRVTNI